MTYHLTGLISAIIFLLTIAGLWSQLGLVWKRKRELASGRLATERPTSVLSLNQFVSSFLAFFSFCLYGACLQRFNHYLVWPRLAASLLTLALLYEIMVDRRDGVSIGIFSACLALVLGAPAILFLNPGAMAVVRVISQALIVGATVVLAQGYIHQIVLIRKCGRTGAVSLRMHQYFFLKDISTIAFALAMGSAAGWPLLLLSSVSAITKLATLWHFRWARSSDLAAERRMTVQPSELPDELLD